MVTKLINLNLLPSINVYYFKYEALYFIDFNDNHIFM